jgi:hypothetical protein
MKRTYAVAFLLMSFASVALADGGGLPPIKTTTKPPKASIVRLADGGGLPPIKTKPPQA